MADININEYVRTEKGSIGKFKSYGIDDVDEKIVYFKNNKGTTCVDENEIVKHSPNIIDLIEIKDLIKFRNKLPNSLEDEEMIIHIFDNDTLEEIKQAVEREEIEILSIVTKEQFSNIEYRLED